MHARHNIPRPPNGQTDILGGIYGDGSIFIDESLDPDEFPEKEGRYRFTLAHEIGHFRYHRNLLIDETFVLVVDGESNDLRIRGNLSNRDLVRAEWQANRFAACLLVPLPLLALEWFNWMKSLRPFVFEKFSNDPRWWAPTDRKVAASIRDSDVRANHAVHDYAFTQVAMQLAPIFNVSTAMMRVRLETVGLLAIVDEVEPWTQSFRALDVEFYLAAARSRVNAHGRIVWR